ncbi:HAMP domain-containing sensor histidine kinase [Pelomonas sp. SE-A7]|uniref:sensor histidine kinase n=1 Tax=Pelomonas sp. SE-A7 TaxID=3054953 RepID=UPI00259CA29D|nr:HAMP domain-containing sensor histidine kinase [Pelomonas sp. SE-A7]MDM4765923.1 HAMP domain-containing sensor histidine kinase [Pelomonas sp. SE-A7]
MNEALCAAVVHDLKNRLTLLSDSLQRMEHQLDKHAAQALARSALSQAQHLTHQMSGLLVAQRSASGKRLPVHLEEASPQELMQELVDDGRLLAAGRLELRLAEPARELPEVWICDRQLLRLALDSALYNALHYARQHIDLGLDLAEDGMLCFSVADDGPGLDAPASPTASGLGLQVCAAVALAHRNRGRQGRSRLMARPGGGALFELAIP